MKLDEGNGSEILTGLDLTSFSSEKIDPGINNRYGWRTEFGFLQYNSMEVNPADWQDL